LQSLPIKLRLFDKYTPLPSDDKPNKHYPLLRKGDRFNQTTIDLSELEVNQIDLGEPYDDDQQSSEMIYIGFLVEPPNGDITFNKLTGELKFNLVRLFKNADRELQF
jgi:hypothetical protein